MHQNLHSNFQLFVCMQSHLWSKITGGVVDFVSAHSSLAEVGDPIVLWHLALLVPDLQIRIFSWTPVQI